ncbi:MAG: PilZ domain-containing protein [Candidatus Omnitrophica bacterium]|nr:PilZ domain-containing protein [Candidatus Omnitrophota bacterium]
MSTPKYKVFNSRHHQRLQVSYLLKYTILKTEEGPFVSNIKDLSAGGVRFWTDQPLAEGSLLKLTILIPPLGRVLETLGRVQRVRFAPRNSIYYIGAGFIELSSEDRETMNQFIEDLLTREAGKATSNVPQVVSRFRPFQPVS